MIAAENIGQRDCDGIVEGSIANYLTDVDRNGTLSKLNAAIEACNKDFLSLNQTIMEDNILSEFYLTNKQFDQCLI